MELHIPQGVFLRARLILEGDAVEVDAPVGHLPDRVLRLLQVGGLLQHLADAVGAGEGAGEEEKHVGDHHQGVHHLEHIAQKSRELAHLHLPGQDQLSAEPQDHHHGGVHDQLEKGQVEHRVLEGGAAGVGELLAHLLEALLLVLPPDEGLDGPDAGEPLLDAAVQTVHGGLLAAVEGTHLADDQGQNEPQNRGADHKDQGQPGVHGKGQPDAQQEHHRPPDHGAQAAVDGVLHHGYVGGHPGHQGRGGEPVQVGEGEALELLILRLPQPPAEAVGRPGGEPGVDKSGDEGQARAQGHGGPQLPDAGHVPQGHAVVNDPCHQQGNGHLKPALHQQEQDGNEKIPPAGAQIPGHGT